MAQGGWGGSWGKGAWGSSVTRENVLVTELVTIGEALSVSVPFEVAAAVPVYPYILRVDYTGFVDQGHTPNFDPANYVIPGLTVYAIIQDPFHGKSLLLYTSEQLAISYTLTVNAAAVQGFGGDPLNPLANTATFNGFPLAATFIAAAQAERKIQVLYLSPMMIDAEYVDASNYTISHIDGTTVPVATVTAIDSTHGELLLGADLEAGGYYVLTISSDVRTFDNQGLSPDANLFQWAKIQPNPIRIAFEQFSGEVTTGLLGQPAGQVFFSPALETAVANSIIQVDEVSVCTRAFDEYQIPDIPDPPILYTFPPPESGGVFTGSLLNSSAGLFATAERLGLARVNLSDLRTDTFQTAVDGPADATLVETIDITRASFLNDVRWETYPAATASIGVFQTADNLTPIGPGPTANINLQP